MNVQVGIVSWNSFLPHQPVARTSSNDALYLEAGNGVDQSGLSVVFRQNGVLLGEVLLLF